MKNRMNRMKSNGFPKRIILLTGFRPFLHFSENPSERIARHLNGKEIGPSYRVAGQILNVAYSDCKMFPTLINHIDVPAAVIMTGLDSNTNAIKLERIAINIEDSIEPDAIGDLARNRRICKNAPDAFFSRLPLEQIQSELVNSGIKTIISNSAGTYVCNSLYFNMLLRLDPSIPCGFIHLPMISTEWTEVIMRDAIFQLIRSVIRHLSGMTAK